MAAAAESKALQNQLATDDLAPNATLVAGYEAGRWSTNCSRRFVARLFRKRRALSEPQSVDGSRNEDGDPNCRLMWPQLMYELITAVAGPQQISFVEYNVEENSVSILSEHLRLFQVDRLFLGSACPA